MSLTTVVNTTTIRSILLIGLLFVLSSCASWQAPTMLDDSALRERAVTETISDVEIRGAVLSAQDDKQFFGTDLDDQGIQTVWVEVVNRSTHTLWLLTSGTDPDYFSPLEVAWPLHRKFASEANRMIDEHFDDLSFKNPIPPGETRNGFLYTNPHKGIRVLNIDLLGQQTLYPFTLFPPIPEEESPERLAEVSHLIAAARKNTIEDEQALREALEQLPCCATSSQGGYREDPINVILVGELQDLAAALVRRGYRQDPSPADDMQHYNGRPPDFVLRKSGQGGATSNWLRIWIAPISYQGQSVMLAQSGRPIGGRFIDPATTRTILHPDIDETRNLVIQDLMYSGGLAKLGFVAGVPPVTIVYIRNNSDEVHYHTDGLRAVMFVITRPLSIEDVQILDWVPLLDRREATATDKLSREKNSESPVQ